MSQTNPSSFNLCFSGCFVRAIVRKTQTTALWGRGQCVPYSAEKPLSASGWKVVLSKQREGAGIIGHSLSRLRGTYAPRHTLMFTVHACNMDSGQDIKDRTPELLQTGSGFIEDWLESFCCCCCWVFSPQCRGQAAGGKQEPLTGGIPISQISSVLWDTLGT